MTKQLWEMTWWEFARAVPIRPIPGVKGELGAQLPNGLTFRFDDKPGRDPVGHARRYVIKTALWEGRAVPADVLAEYPDLTAEASGQRR